MKIQYRYTFVMTIFGAIIVILISVGYYILSNRIVANGELKKIEILSEEISSHMDSQLKSKTNIGKTLSSAPILRDALIKSNTEFNTLSEEERKQEIDKRNQKWMIASDINDPFIQAHMNNRVAKYFKSQQAIIPGEYGEIFLTNRFGVMVATTGKLTTLAHAHKYWWQAAYNDGQGRIFLDDRGFDTSAKGYVLGVVIPIMDKNEIIGILKCNVNIIGPLTDVIEEFYQSRIGRLRIVRTGGLVVSEHGVIPLSTQLSEDLVGKLGYKERGSGIISENDKNQLIAYSPIEITMGSEQIGFGGRQESIDHIQGNKGEAWQVLITINEDQTIGIAHKTAQIIVLIGFLFTFFAAVVALILGKLTAKPIIELSKIAQSFGEGQLEIRTDIHSNSEIGSLAKSLNIMAENIQETMTSRDELIKINNDLQKALTEIKTLSGLLPICSNCKKIRDEKGYWEQIESYIVTHTDALFSHSLCEPCAEEMYGKEDWYNNRKGKREKK